MRYRSGVIRAAMLAAALGLWPAADAGAGLFDWKGARRAAPQRKLFTISAEYSGHLSGDLIVNGVAYRLPPEVPVYQVNRGLVPQGGYVTGVSLYLAGERKGGVAVVRSVIVRPLPGDARRVGERNDAVRELGPDAPQ